tara:strand:- start:465 stop:962 length:498 start_codon:yes stop_codon:yes gene_type:complete
VSFSGRVDRESHEGGLLVSFEGRAPRLGAVIRIAGGRILGKVETVLGAVDSPLLHIHPLKENVDSRATIGSPVEIAPRDRTPKKKRRFSRDNSPDKKRGSGVNRGRGQNRSFGRSVRKGSNSGTSRVSKRSSKSGSRGGNRNSRKPRFSGDKRGSGKRRGYGKRR